MSIRHTSGWLPLALALVLLGGPGAVLAQDDATPTTEDEAAGTNHPFDFTGGGDPQVGDEVQYLDEDGDEIAVATVLDVTDPFDDFSQFFTSEEEGRYVAVEVGIRSTGDELDVEPYHFAIQTGDGFAYSRGFVSRPEGREDPPEIESVEVEEGDETSGVIFFAVPEDAELARILWEPENGRLLILADLREQDARA